VSVKKILIVDDSSTELTHLRTLIADAGHLVLTATNGQEAFAKAKTDKPDLIFLDIIMPGQDGFSTCRELTADADTQHIPVVIVTNKKQKADRIWARMQGAKGYITKPYTSDDIIEQIESLR